MMGKMTWRVSGGNKLEEERVQTECRYAALHEFHSGTPAKRPYFDDWRRMLSCARFLAQWFTAAEVQGECIGLIDAKKLKFGVDDGRVQYDGRDVTQLTEVGNRKMWREIQEQKPEELTWSVTQFLPPELLEQVMEREPESAMEQEARCEQTMSEHSEKEIHAGVWSDRYQLSVLLFQLFFGCHPISWEEEVPGDTRDWLYALKKTGSFRFAEGRRFPETFLYAYAARRWKVFPDWFREACTFTFTEAMREPEKRIPAQSWLDMVNKLCDTYSRVKNDETGRYRHTFVNDDEKNKNFSACMMVLQTDTGRIFLSPGSKVYKGDFCGEPGSGEKIGETGRLKKHSDGMGIRMSVPWEMCRFEHRHPVAPGEVRVLEADMVLLVENHLGLIR